MQDLASWESDVRTQRHGVAFYLMCKAPRKMKPRLKYAAGWWFVMLSNSVNLFVADEQTHYEAQSMR